MKKIGLVLLKGLFLIILFTSTSVAKSTSSHNAINSALAAVTSSGAVVNYLESIGYQVFHIMPMYGTNNWIAITCDSNGQYWVTTVYYSSSNSLLGHENDTL